MSFIDRLQPYKRGNGQRRSLLWILHELSNTDKHNVIVLVDRWQLAPPTITVGKRRPREGTTHGPPSAEYVEMEFRPRAQLAFGEGCDAAVGLSVIDTLNGIADVVDSTIEAFAADFP